MAIAATEPLPASAYKFHDQEYDDDEYVLGLPAHSYTKDEEAEIVEQMAWRLNSRFHGLLETSRECGTVTFLHRTVKDCLNTQNMSKFFTDKIPPGFNLDLTLLKVYTALIKRSQFWASDYESIVVHSSQGKLHIYTEAAFKYAVEVESIPSLRLKSYKALEELQCSIIKSNITGQPLLKENLVTCQHVGFLQWKFPQNTAYFSSSGFYPLLRASALSDITSPSLIAQWRDSGAEILRCVLEPQDLDLNEPTDPLSDRSPTPWSLLIYHHTASWSDRDRSVADQRFWILLKHDILRISLRRGANPNAIVSTRRLQNSAIVEGWSAFVTYLVLSFEIAPDVTREALYLKVVNAFLFSGAILDLPSTVLTDFACERVAMASTTEKFFGRLSDMSSEQLQACNLRLLGAVAKMLLSNMDEWTEPVMAVFEKEFPHEIPERRDIKKPATSYPNVRGAKRDASTDLKKESPKALRTLSPGSFGTSRQNW